MYGRADAPDCSDMHVSSEQLQQVLDLYQAGQYLRAYEFAQTIGPLAKWDNSADARVLAGRLAMNLGGARLGRALHGLAWRANPEHPEARYYYARNLFEAHGPLRTWEFMRACGSELAGATPIVQSDWLAFHAQIAAAMRDFENADAWLARADAVAPDHPWLHVERSSILERQDRYPDALAAVQHALDLHPWYRPAVQHAGHLLQLLDRDADAVKLLTEASQHIQSGHVVAQLATILTELGDHAEARRQWDRVLELSPLADKHFAKHVAASRSDAAYQRGDYAAAAALATESTSPFHLEVTKQIRVRLEAGEPIEAKRVLLPVTFVRQHHMTCAPATLSALSRFWSMPVEHLSLSEEICYDGTPAHSERQWAEQNGYAAREFTVDWASTCALIDRGIPFTLTTVEPTSAHLQAAIGYDALRGTVMVRDPFLRNTSEYIDDRFRERYAASGPRGMAIVPAARAAELSDDPGAVPLPDAKLYDVFYEVQRALSDHRRDAAAAACDAMAASDPEHRLTLTARRTLAAYDGDDATALACIEQQLAQYPDNDGLLLARLGYLRAMGRRDDRLALLRQAVGRKGADTVFKIYLAQELADDAREHANAERLLREALRYRRGDGVAFAALADVLWTDPARREEALQLYRWAACLNEKQEGFARTYFGAARHFKRTDEPLRMLRDRVARFGDKSPGPARSLGWALEELDRTAEAFDVLETSLRDHPDDADLQLHAALTYSRYGRRERAEAMLASAEGRTRRTGWLRVAADVDAARGALADACDRWRQVVEAEPLAVDAHRRYTQLLTETAGPAAASAHVQAAADRFPHHYGLQQVCIDWLREHEHDLEHTSAAISAAASDGEAAAGNWSRCERVIRNLIGVHPADAWARRELGYCLVRQNRFDEALAEAETALALEPNNATSHFFVGLALSRLGRVADARAALRVAIERSVDYTWAANLLLETCDTPAERQEQLEFVRRELVRQTIFGDGLLNYRTLALDVLDGDAVLSLLREALAARPDLWHAHTAVTRQLTTMNRLDEALAVAQAAVERFPLLPITWFDLSVVRRYRGEADEERAALERALEISPGWSAAGRMLAESHERGGDLARAAALLERTTSHAPLDAYGHAALADVYWKLGRRAEAIARAQRSVLVEPGFEEGWQALQRYSREVRRDDDGAVKLARRLTEKRPGSAWSWLVLARMMPASEPLSARMDALDRAIALNPRLSAAHDLRATLLAEASRFDEAIAACSPPAWRDRVRPVELTGREAWIESKRGDVQRAVTLIRAALEQEPSYYWGWSRLCDWLEELKDLPGYLKAANEMAARWPHDPVVHGCIGDALRRSGDRARAREAFTRAVQLSPEYDYGVSALFEMALDDDDDFATAEQMLGILRLHAHKEIVAARTAQLAARRLNMNAALAALDELCSARSNIGTWPIQHAMECVERAGWGAECERVFREAAKRPGVNPFVGWFWMKRLGNQHRWKEAVKALNEILARGEVGPASIGSLAVEASLQPAGRAKQRWFVNRVIRKHRDLLRGSDETWAHVSSALMEFSDYKGIARWMSDWRNRTERQPWMLLNLVVAHRALGNDAAAREVGEDAVGLPVADDTSAEHRIWLAVAAGVDASASHGPNPAGASAALARLEGLRRDTVRPYYQALIDLTHAHVELARHDGSGPVPPRVRDLVRSAEAAFPQYASLPALRHAHRQVRQAIRRRFGLLRTPLWAHGFRLSRPAAAAAAPVQNKTNWSVFWWIFAAVMIARLIVTLLFKQ